MPEVVKRVKNAVLFSDGTIRIDNLRLSYPHLTVPYSKPNKDGTPGTPKYSAIGLGEKNTHREAKDLVKSVIDDILKDKHKDPKTGQPMKMKPENKFLRDGDLGDKEEYEGCFTFSASETNKPALRGKGKERLSDADANRILYAGCRVSMLIRPWYQNNNFGRRMNAGLQAVQFMADDEPFGQGRITDEDVDDAFDSYDDDDGMEDQRSRRRPAADDDDEI